MLSSVLRSPRAVQVNVAIMRVFVRLRGRSPCTRNWPTNWPNWSARLRATTPTSARCSMPSANSPPRPPTAPGNRIPRKRSQPALPREEEMNRGGGNVLAVGCSRPAANCLAFLAKAGHYHSFMSVQRRITTAKCLLSLLVAWGVLLTAVDLTFAQAWTQTSAPMTNWTAVASSADGTKLAAAAYLGGI